MYSTIANLYIRSLTSLSLKDLPLVGGKNASLGEMMQAINQEGIQIPKGFAITVDAYQDYLKANNLTEKIKFYLTELEKGNISLEKAGKFIRQLFYQSPLPESIQALGITIADGAVCKERSIALATSFENFGTPTYIKIRFLLTGKTSIG